jgi:hypothetical protein
MTTPSTPSTLDGVSSAFGYKREWEELKKDVAKVIKKKLFRNLCKRGLAATGRKGESRRQT